MKNIKIDVVSDIACPWCYVGKRNLEKALNSLPDYTVSVNWHPFQLDASIPKEGLDRDTYLRNKFGSMERYEGLAEHLKSKGREVGISFQKMKKVPNTLPLHHLIYAAGKEGFANELKELLFKAYFENSVDLTDENELFKIMKEFGWETEQTQAALENESIAYAVNQEIRNYQNMGVTGVPFFIFDDTHGFSGAQPPETFINIIKKLGDKIDDSVACDTGDPNC